jgi:UDP-N-acetylmuramoylalanine--D-glutamate ligase
MKYLIVGLGETGFSVVQYLCARGAGASVAVVDSRVAPPYAEHLRLQYPEIPLSLGGFPEACFHAAEVIILSPGLSIHDARFAHFISSQQEIYGDIELFARAVQAPVIAITGSNGKSTVTTLVGEMAKHAGKIVGVGGNLGEPALSLLSLKPQCDLYVLELSSFQLEITHSLAPTASVVLNLSPDHLDWHGSVAAYYSAKSKVHAHSSCIIWNRDEANTYDMRYQNSFGIGVPPEDAPDAYGVREQAGLRYLAQGHSLLLPMQELKLLGDHNVSNALAALALGTAVGLSQAAMIETLRTFRGLPHRCEYVGQKNHVLWVNDSKGTNVGATIAALQGLKNSITGRWILIAGGEGKGADFSLLIAPVVQYCKKVILFGRDAAVLHACLGAHIPCVQVHSLHEAVVVAGESAEQGDGVLLSPACASTDMFRNYEDRGEQFVMEARKLGFD